MYDVELVLEILRQIHVAGKRIERRFSPVQHSNDFLANDDGLDPSCLKNAPIFQVPKSCF
jgi:hypothetical protein